MPTISSRGNTNVSKIWLLVVFAFVMMISITWKLFQGLEEIALHTTEASAQINDLMNDSH